MNTCEATPSAAQEIRIQSLGTPEIDSPLSRNLATAGERRVVFTVDEELVDEGAAPRPMSFELAGPRDRIYFDPSKTKCAIVTCGGLCPGINDGPALEHTLEEFWSLGEGLLSVACVPVGLTRYREGLYPLVPFNRQTAGEALDILERWGARWKAERGARTVYASDELYLLAGRPIPPLEFYEDFPQIENGVGMLRNLQDEFDWALEDLELPDAPRRVTIPTGECGFQFLNQLLDGLRRKCHNISIDLLPVHNDFFGGTVNVTGLLTGQDILKNLRGRDLGDEVLLATNMMKAGEDIFLDDMTREELSAALGVPCRRVGSTGEALVCAICGLPEPETPGFNPYEGSWEHR